MDKHKRWYQRNREKKIEQVKEYRERKKRERLASGEYVEVLTPQGRRIMRLEAMR